VSRGLGSRERQILAALEERPAVYLIDLLPPPHTRAQYASIHRAAMSLQRKGKIVGHGLLGLVSRPGYDLPDRWPRMQSVFKVVDDVTRKWRWRLERMLQTDEEYDRMMEERRRQLQSFDVDLWVTERNRQILEERRRLRDESRNLSVDANLTPRRRRRRRPRRRPRRGL
jgi:hypothetical protein